MNIEIKNVFNDEWLSVVFDEEGIVMYPYHGCGIITFGQTIDEAIECLNDLIRKLDEHRD